MVTAEQVLSRLPPNRNELELIKDKQYVPDIIQEVCTAHRLYGKYYDMFSDLFYSCDPETVTEQLYWFCKQNITYSEEDIDFQSSSVPQGILSRGKGDCKYFALFNAGVIGSLNRLYGCSFDAAFYFAGYRRAKEPYHVYVAVVDRGNEIWLDPTPGNGGTPTVLIAEKI